MAHEERTDDATEAGNGSQTGAELRLGADQPHADRRPEETNGRPGERKAVAPYLAVGLSTVVHGVGERKHIGWNLDPHATRRLKLLGPGKIRKQAGMNAVTIRIAAPWTVIEGLQIDGNRAGQTIFDYRNDEIRLERSASHCQILRCKIEHSAGSGIAAYGSSHQVIAYSTGNFVFDYFTGAENDTAILDVTLSADGVDSINWIPIEIQNGFPRPAKGDEVTRIMSHLKQLPPP